MWVLVEIRPSFFHSRRRPAPPVAAAAAISFACDRPALFGGGYGVQAD